MCDFNTVGGLKEDPKYWRDEVETKLVFLGTEIADLFQRYGHALDRIISLEEKIQSLSGKAKKEVDE